MSATECAHAAYPPWSAHCKGGMQSGLVAAALRPSAAHIVHDLVLHEVGHFDDHVGLGEPLNRRSCVLPPVGDADAAVLFLVLEPRRFPVGRRGNVMAD